MSSTFYLSPKDRIGYLTLIILFLIISASAALYQSVFALNESEQLALIEKVIAEQEQAVQAQVRETITIKDVTESLTSIKLGTFDPNVASIETLIEQGFSEYAANNLEKYRDKGGEIKKSSDLYRIYGLDTATIIQMKDRLILPKPKKEARVQNRKKEVAEDSNHLPIDKTIEEKRGAQELKSFDPNTASQYDLQKYGLSSYAAKNLTKYISKGGELREPEDLKRIYGIDDDTYTKILPYIKIENNEESSKEHTDFTTDSSSSSSSSSKWTKEEGEEAELVEVPKEIISLNINIATQEELMKISGIGPSISKGIIKYRDMLGGYVEVSQLKEVYNVSEESYEKISQHLFVDGEIKRFYIPSTKFKQVLRHPYIDFETTKIVKNMSIMNYAEDLQALIDDGTIDKRLIPYIYIHDPDLD